MSEYNVSAFQIADAHEELDRAVKDYRRDQLRFPGYEDAEKLQEKFLKFAELVRAIREE